jgi:hypothetical protein
MTRLAEEKLGLKMETTLLGGDAGNYDTKLRLALTGPRICRMCSRYTEHR